ncbi:MAG: hypothetical protein LC754_06740 [Acidobacteria bacterium]|nr:hypothetical protein [Acidobacteriota bacterium]
MMNEEKTRALYSSFRIPHFFFILSILSIPVNDFVWRMMSSVRDIQDDFEHNYYL